MESLQIKIEVINFTYLKRVLGYCFTIYLIDFQNGTVYSR